MGRRWLHDLEPVNYLENLGHIDHCACFPRTQSQRKYVEGEILKIRGDLLSASSQAARSLGLTAAALAVEWTSAPCFILFYFILFSFQDYSRAERSARRYIPGETGQEASSDPILILNDR